MATRRVGLMLARLPWKTQCWICPQSGSSNELLRRIPPGLFGYIQRASIATNKSSSLFQPSTPGSFGYVQKASIATNKSSSLFQPSTPGSFGYVQKASIATNKSASSFRPSYKQDDVSESAEVIYASTSLRWYLIPTYVLTSGCALLSATCAVNLAYLMYSGEQFTLAPSTSATDVLLNSDPFAMAVFASAAGIALYLAVRRMLTSTMLRIYYQESQKQFSGIFYDSLLQRRKLVFRSSDVRYKVPNRILREMAGNCKIKGKPVYLIKNNFRNEGYYQLMLSQALSEEMQQ